MKELLNCSKDAFLSLEFSERLMIIVLLVSGLIMFFSSLFYLPETVAFIGMGFGLVVVTSTVKEMTLHTKNFLLKEEIKILERRLSS